MYQQTSLNSTILKNAFLLMIFLTLADKSMGLDNRLSADNHFAPTISNCPVNITTNILDASPGDCLVSVSWTEPTAMDINTPVTVSKSHLPGDDFPVGTTTVTYTFTNALSQSSTCSFDVTVEYRFFDLPSSQTITVDASCNRTALWIPPSDCGGSVIIASSGGDLNGTSFPIGTTEITYIAIRSGSIIDDTGSFDITVVDNISPEFNDLPTDLTVAANANCEAIVSWTEPTVTDNCTSSIIPSSTSNPGSLFPIGTTTVSYTAADEAGNTINYDFDITVEDQTAPTFTNLPDDIIIAASGPNCEATVTWPNVNATDNCDSSVDVVRDIPGSTFSLGTTTIEYTATDDAGNQQIRSFDVTVVDEESPVLTNCPNTITVTANNNCEAIATWPSPTFTDSCDPGLSISRSHDSGDEFPIGSTTVNIIATDDSGNEVICTFNVIVEDNTPPILANCPTDITIITGDNCGAIAEWIPPTATDNCNSPITPSANFDSGDSFALGTTEVVYTASDDAGNEVTCSFNVTVVDQTAPVFINCPTDIEVAAAASCIAGVTWSNPTATDNCDANVMITSSHNSGDSFSFGTTSVTYTAMDDAGNSNQCTFNVTVIDQSGPEIANCPSDIEITTADCEAAVTWDEPSATDNCSSSVTSSSDFSPGDSFPLGSTSVTYTFIDDAGNQSQCVFDVLVINPDALAVRECPEDIIVETDESGTAQVSWTEPTAVSSCSEVSVTQSHFPGDTFEVGTTQVIYEFVDAFQTVVTCTFEVTVKIREIEFEIPKLLTPNNDGNNDIWTLEGIENFPDNEVVIIDRWGGELFKKSGYDNQRIVWDGTNKSGKIVPTGTYFYYISVQTNSDTQNKQGFIEVVQ